MQEVFLVSSKQVGLHSMSSLLNVQVIMRVLTFQVCVYTFNPSDSEYDDSAVVAAILIAGVE